MAKQIHIFKPITQIKNNILDAFQILLSNTGRYDFLGRILILFFAYKISTTKLIIIFDKRDRLTSWKSIANRHIANDAQYRGMSVLYVGSTVLVHHRDRNAALASCNTFHCIDY